MRPGLILWVIIDLAMIAWQYERIGRVTDSIILTTAFHAFYVLDAEFNEVGLLANLRRQVLPHAYHELPSVARC